MEEYRKTIDMNLKDMKKLLNEILMNERAEDVMMNIIEEYEDALALKKNEECLVAIVSDVDERGDYKSESWAKFVSEFSGVLQALKVTGCKELWIHAHTFALYPKAAKPLSDILERNFQRIKLLVPSALGGGIGLALLISSEKIFLSEFSLIGPFMLETQSTRLYNDYVSLRLFKNSIEKVNEIKDLELWSASIFQYKTELEEELKLIEALVISHMYSKAKCPVQEIVNRLLKTNEYLALPLSARDLGQLIKGVEVLKDDDPMLVNMVKYNSVFKIIFNEIPHDILICSRSFCSYW